jgi:hypothetical protein
LFEWCVEDWKFGIRSWNSVVYVVGCNVKTERKKR